MPILLLLAIVVTAFHDGGAYARARRQLVEGTRQAAMAAAAARTDRTTAGRTAAEVGKIYGVTVYGYDQEPFRAGVWGRMEVEGTWILHVITAYVEDRDSDAPYTIEHSEYAPIR